VAQRQDPGNSGRITGPNYATGQYPPKPVRVEPSTDGVRLALSRTGFPAHNRSVVSRFTSECELCAELLTDYISAGNEIVDSKERLQTHTPASASRLASALIDHALKRRNQARKRLLLHKDLEH